MKVRLCYKGMAMILLYIISHLDKDDNFIGPVKVGVTNNTHRRLFSSVYMYVSIDCRSAIDPLSFYNLDIL